jgi:hypothetical protein
LHADEAPRRRASEIERTSEEGRRERERERERRERNG